MLSIKAHFRGLSQRLDQQEICELDPAFIMHQHIEKVSSPAAQLNHILTLISPGADRYKLIHDRELLWKCGNTENPCC